MAGAGLRAGVTLTHSAAAYLAAGHTAYTPPSLSPFIIINNVCVFCVLIMLPSYERGL